MDYSKQRFERLFKDSYPHMYRMAFSMVEDANDAKDAVNQVFTQLWKGKPDVSEESIRGYLLAATRKQRPASELLAKATPPTTEETVCDCGEVKPYFPGGDRALQAFVKNNLHYPDLAMEYGVRGRVVRIRNHFIEQIC